MEKIKQFIESEKGKDILIVIIVILVGLGCFELGRLSKETGSGGIKIEYPSQDSGVTVPVDNTQTSLKASGLGTASAIMAQTSSGKYFFASSRGTKYYTISCSAGKTIKQENRVYFATGEEAERAGYALSSGCN